MSLSNIREQVSGMGKGGVLRLGKGGVGASNVLYILCPAGDGGGEFDNG